LPSFAKINWSLRILGRRLDGYHEVRTVLQTVSLRDRLHFAAHSDADRPDILLSCDDAEIPLGVDNLIVRAANALRYFCGVKAGAVIHLEKRIPAKGGLGGASSNAAVVLLGLTRLWNLSLSQSALIAIGATLGADVPFFLLGGCALATGIGTDLRAIDDSNAGEARKYLVIVTPNATVSTAAAYQSLKAPALTSPNDASILSISYAEELSELSHLCDPHNDFEEVIFGSEPEIRRAKEALLEVGASSSLLAGSGSSVFGIFENKQAQERAVNEIQAEIGWRVFPAVMVSRNEYLQELGSCGVALSRS
jgi:4-diphosphocytidyl-2-C-methyl-D-erythritol kinase